MRDHSEESFSDGTPVPAEEPPAGKGKGPSQAQILVGMAEDAYRLIRADDGRAYAVPRLGPQIAVPLASKSENSLRTRLSASLHRQTGQVASSSNLSDAITVLTGEAADLEPGSGATRWPPSSSSSTRSARARPTRAAGSAPE